MPYKPPCNNRLVVSTGVGVYLNTAVEVTYVCDNEVGHMGVHSQWGEVTVNGRRVWYRMTWRGDPDPEYEKK